MMRLLTRVQLAYLGLFLACCVAVFAYQAYYVWPVQKCAEHGGWWAPKYHMCGQPVPIWRFTGRLPHGATPPAAPTNGR
jgi:hypothetical protein